MSRFLTMARGRILTETKARGLRTRRLRVAVNLDLRAGRARKSARARELFFAESGSRDVIHGGARS